MTATISSIEAWACGFPLPGPFHASWIPGLPSETNHCIVYRLTTSDGIVGASAGISLGNEHLAWVDLLRAYLLGKPVASVEDLLKTLRTSTEVLGYRAWQIEPALWDAIGKQAGMPVAALLGGARTTVNAYASTGSLKSPSEHVDTVARLVEENFTAVKLRVRDFDPSVDEACVEAVRESFPDLTIMVDANQGWRVHGLAPYPEWDLKRTFGFAAVCEELDVYWLEEPLPQHNYEGYASLRAATSVRIAGGEMLADLHPFREHLVRGGLDIVQPDTILSGGILISRKIAALAEAFGVGYAPHTWTNGVGLAANLQSVCAAANGTWCEFPYEPGSWEPSGRDAMLTEPIGINADGTISLPDAPGLGVEIDWERVETQGTKI